jgi:hypothetical protein
LTQFQELPVDKTFGHGFNYAVWSANTTVTLANVPWNSDYRDIVRFDNPAGLDNFIDTASGPVTTTTGVTYAAMGRPIRLQIPFERANTFNYLRAHNPAQPITGGDTGRSYYYFVVGVNYIAPDTTELIIQLDVWQSFGYSTTFGNCFIERGHVGIANEESFTNFGRDYLTTPEGLDLGNEYEIRKQYSLTVGSARFDAPGLGIPDYSILVASSTALDEDAGTVAAPKLTSAKGSQMENLPNGAEIYLFNALEHFKAFMVAMKDKPWVTQGIMSVQAVPRMQRYGVNLTSTYINEVPVDEVASGVLNNIKTNVGTGWRNQLDLGRYWRLTKFATYPYMVIEMTSYTGTPLVLKPECWQDANMGVVEVPHFSPPNARLAFYPYRYNSTDETPATSDDEGIINDGGEFLNMVTGIMNFPTFSVVNNGYMQFMASNANSIAYQHSSADWSQQRALQGAQTSYDQATSGIGTSQDVTGQGISAAAQQTKLSMDTMRSQGFQSAGNSTLNGFRNLDPVGMAQGVANAGVTYAINTNQANQSNTIASGLSAGINRATTDNMGYVRDTNQQLAQFGANGDYANAIAGINAKVQDAKLTQPTTAGQVGGDAFNLAAYKWGVELKVKMLQPAIMNAIGEFWLRYGYAVNRFGRMPEGFMVMDKFTYWKLKETYITSANCPETFKQTLRGIFEKGVTVWKNPLDIGNIDTADNEPLTGVVL